MEVPSGTPNGGSWYTTGKNRIGADSLYDQAGNGSPLPGYTNRYDVENRMVEVGRTSPPLNVTLAYDGEGRRVKRTVDGALTVYDANGNVISGLSGLPGTYAYDVENRLVDNTVESYGYGASNQRLWKRRSDGVYEVYLHGLGGELVEVFEARSGTPWTVVRQANSRRAWFGGRLLRVGTGTVNADRLGTYQGTYPYGELQGPWGSLPEKFATYRRDATGLDYAMNRYYSPQMGRFLSADPYQASGGPAEPGSWNRYAYVGGDPMNFNDPAGLQLRGVTFSTGQTCFYVNGQLDSCEGNYVTYWIDDHLSGSGGMGGGTLIEPVPPVDGGDKTKPTETKSVAPPAPSRNRSSAIWRLGQDGQGKPLELLEAGVPSLGSVAARIATTYAVYTGTNGVGGRYIDITMDFMRRAAEHSRNGIAIFPYSDLVNLSLFEARAIEQALIEREGLASLPNKINSIAATSPYYNEARKLATQILEGCK